MNEEQANIQAQAWWGVRGKASLVIHYSLFAHKPIGSTYTVGLTLLPARLGGRIVTVCGKSRYSFESAFREAEINGYGLELPNVDSEEEYGYVNDK